MKEAPRMALKSYRELTAWQKAMDLVQITYEAVRTFPREEIYGLTSQLKRAVVSVPSNIAEGQGRKSTREFLRHLSIAYGSLMEVESQILVAQRLQYLSQEVVERVLELTSELGRLVNGLSNALNSKLTEGAGR
jgi:four helix bundle protein